MSNMGPELPVDHEGSYDHGAVFHAPHAAVRASMGQVSGFHGNPAAPAYGLRGTRPVLPPVTGPVPAPPINPIPKPVV